MSFMLPAAPAHARSITGVASDVVRALRGAGPFGSARSAVLCVIDGLGALQLRGNAGHARHLSGMMHKRDVARSVFPSTTAAALTSLLTGADPGQHGLVGYRVLDPASGAVVNPLSGWVSDGIDPATWQRSRTVFEEATADGIRCFAVGPREYDGSGFTQAVLRGAEYVGEDVVSERVRVALALAAQHEGALIYCYIPEVDKAGHRHGVASPQWLAALEDVDAAFAAAVPAQVGLVVTADHGMIDVPRHRHVLLGVGDPRWDGVAQLGGEPRMMHVYARPDADIERLAAIWRAEAQTTADVLTRDEAIAYGLFGAVDPEVTPRIGDLLVVTRGTWAYYDDTLTDKRAMRMVGQHGSVTPEETVVPLIRAGAFTG
ncbi:alkaline phosphatase family protein [Microbacterium gorillae]|uniref:alkaline phosphatase family protein n=1 Tax=Microbacterium gorillae TaxID=1231063 RepID=UPI0006938B06|nr:nucleotide pyrophosphatase/phosphodiesterase family protein [Microbacterium gorillae]